MLRWWYGCLLYLVRGQWGDYTFVSLYGEYPTDYRNCREVFMQDDAPFVAVNLTFLFPWYGTYHNRTWISPNGALHFDGKPPCCPNSESCMFLSGNCDLNDYFNNIAACTTDLDPSQGGHIRYCLEPNRLRVFFEYIPLFFFRSYDTGWGRNETYSFYIEINPSGRINVGYSEVRDPRFVPGWTNNDPDRSGDRLWMVGLRPPVRYPSLQNANQADWRVHANGTYPPKSIVRSGTRIAYFPFAPEACSTPQKGTAGTKVSIVMHLFGANNNTGMWKEWKLFCRFGVFAAPVPAVYNFSSGFLECIAPSVIGTVVLAVWTAEEPIIPNLTFSFSNDRASVSPCEHCAAHLPKCSQDCNGDWEGTAVVDACEMCVGGATGQVEGQAKDCKGICYGPFLSIDGRCVCESPLCALMSTRPQFGGVSPLLSAPPSQYLTYSFAAHLLPSPSQGSWNILPLPMAGVLEVELPFSFLFYGAPITSIEISQQGVIFAGLASNCVPLFPLALRGNGTAQCPSDYSLLAGFMTELVGVEHISEIASVATDTFALVRYSNMVQNTSGSSCSLCRANFTIGVFANGSLVVNIEAIFNISNGRGQFVGVMGPLANASGIPGSNESGLIRPVTEVMGLNNGQSVGFCQMGTLLCVSPKWGPPAGGNMVRISSSFLDCAMLDLIEFDCSFGGARSPASYNSSTNTLNCLVHPGAPDETVIFQLLQRASGVAVPQSREGEKPTGSSALNTSQYRFLDFTYTILVYSYLTLDRNDSLTEEICDNCGHLNDKFCKQDCNGDWGGQAYLDSCGECQGGKAPDRPDRARDCNGLCFGNSRRTDGQCACPGVSSCFSGLPTRLKNKNYLNQQYVMHAMLAKPEMAMISLNATNLKSFECARDTITHVVLPFTFKYWGVPTREVFISPLGAVFLSQPLANCPLLPVKSSFDSLAWAPQGAECGWNVIAGSLARYSLTTATVSYTLSESVFTVKYANLIPNGSVNPDHIHSFQISLFATSDIAVWYSEMSEPPAGNPWLVGAFQAWGSAIPLMNVSYGQPQKRGVLGEDISTKVLALERHEWGLNASRPTGTFPRRRQVTSNTLLRYCALTTELCMWPARGDARGSTRVNIALSSSAAVVACLQNGGFTAQCNFGGILVPATFDEKAKGITCASPPSSVATSSAVLVTVLLDGVSVPSATPLFFVYYAVGTHPTFTPFAKEECECASLMPEICPVDCMGIVLGTANVDKCGLCAGGRSGEVSNAVLDCEGICYGPFQTYDVAKVDGNRAYVCGCSPTDPMCAKRLRSDGPLRISAAVSSLDRYRTFILVTLIITFVGFVLHWIAKKLRRFYRKRRVNPVDDDHSVFTENNAYAVALMEMTERTRQSVEALNSYSSEHPD